MSDPQLDETMPFPRPENGEAAGAAKSRPGKGDAVSSPPVELVGRQLGDFRVLRRLGAGGMAEVFLAEQASLKRSVALKVLKPELLQESDDTHLKRFKQEATAAANLNHPHIVQVYAIGEQEGVHYIAQEYVAGMTLREWLRKHGPPDPGGAIKVIRQVALALQAAGEAGIVHRDIKPENILLTKKGEAKVADFGLAQLTQVGERVQLTQVGLTMGTPLYMSPEQVAGKAVDQRSDVYSLGVTAYHLLAGNPPFRGETALSVAVQHLNTPPESLRMLRPDLPVALCELIEKMMDKRPERRYQTAAEVADDLRALGAAIKADPLAAAKMGLGSFTVVKAPAGSWPLDLDRFFEWSGRRHAVMLATSAAIVLVLSAGLGWATRPADPFRTPPADVETGKLGSAREQFIAALFTGTAEAYQAVLDHWPEDRIWRPHAMVRLALIRLSEGDRSGADALFRELTASSDKEARADGFAGLAVLAAIQDDKAEFSRIVVNQLTPLVTRDDADLHPELERLLSEVRRRQRLDSPDLDRLLDEVPADQRSEPRPAGAETGAGDGLD